MIINTQKHENCGYNFEDPGAAESSRADFRPRNRVKSSHSAKKQKKAKISKFPYPFQIFVNMIYAQKQKSSRNNFEDPAGISRRASRRAVLHTRNSVRSSHIEKLK